jgi:hypothetical protein
MNSEIVSRYLSPTEPKTLCEKPTVQPLSVRRGKPNIFCACGCNPRGAGFVGLRMESDSSLKAAQAKKEDASEKN